ncbi:hypothetical protein Droror1_Dr00013811 [Drosera rotundifolia]
MSSQASTQHSYKTFLLRPTRNVCKVKNSMATLGCTVILMRVVSGSSVILYFLAHSPGGIFLLLSEEIEGSEEDENFQGRVQVYASDVLKSLDSVPVVQFMCGIPSFQFPDEVFNDYVGVYSSRCAGCEIGQLLKDICGVDWVMEVRKRVELVVHCRNMLPDEMVEATGEKCA